MEQTPTNQEKLCQMDKKSCGGCCCIEIPDDNKDELKKIFQRRREAYKKHLSGDIPNIENYESEIKKEETLLSVDTLDENPEKKCHFLGFTDDEETKIGCLAHPSMNRGVDLRKRGFYKDEIICDKFLCAAAEIYETLTPWQKKLFRLAIEEWNWYNMSDQDEMYKMIKKFKDLLPKIEATINQTMETETLRQHIRDILK